MKIKFDSRQFRKDMNNIMSYSSGFLEGINAGKTIFLNTLGIETIELLKEYLDANARVNPELLHHVYEWNRVGSPEARLFDLEYTVSGLGLSFKSSFKQSTSIQNGSNVPFYDKARIMENGIPVKIRPVRAEALRFVDNGEEVFTKSEVQVDNPGGNTQGQYQKAFDTFFNKYFTQAFLKASGIGAYLENPVVYKKNLQAGKRSGKSRGLTVGYRWIANAGMAR